MPATPSRLDRLHWRRVPCAPPPFREQGPHVLLCGSGSAGTAASPARGGTGGAAREEQHERVDGEVEAGGVASSSSCEVGLRRRACGRRDVARPGEVDDARLLVCVARWRSAVLDP